MSKPDAPPSYDEVVGGPSSGASGSSRPVARPAHTTRLSNLDVPNKHNGSIPPAGRRSMEDEHRELPPGWIRQLDSTSHHQYFVDTKANPPRSIWHHPYDDIEYLRTLPSEERERLEEIQRKPPSREDIINAESDQEDGDHGSHDGGYLPPRPTDPPKGLSKYGRKLKDKLTDSTHEQREAERRKREADDAEMYRRHQAIRQAMRTAMETGEPQIIGKDKEGHDVYIEPPPNTYGGGGYGGGQYGGGQYGGGQYGQGMGGRGRGYNPYVQGPYRQPNARYVQYPVPQGPYGRPYGGGYGMGMGMPLMGGMMGGALLGGLLF